MLHGPDRHRGNAVLRDRVNVELSIQDVSVMLAMPTHRDIPVPTVVSLLETADLMRTKGIPFEIQMQVGGSIIETARSKVASLFLQSDKSRLFWVDSDIKWKADDFLRLLALSTKMPVVSGIYPSKSDPPLFFLSVEKSEVETNEFGCFPVKGVGLGFTVIRRDVIESLAKDAPLLKFPDLPEPIPHIFRCDSENGEFRGEDMAFFADIRALGHPVFIDPSVTLGHVGSKTYTASIRDHLARKE